MTEYIVQCTEIRPPGHRCDPVPCGRPSERLVRCRDCANCATTADGSGPYCHLGITEQNGVGTE